MSDDKKPAIRFKNYSDDWEQRKLGDIASSFEYGLNAAAKEYDGENKYIRITDIDDNTHEFLTDNLTSPDIDLTGADNYKLTEGDILFARTGASVGKSYIYRNSDGLVYYAGFLIRARIKEEYDAEFVFQNTLTDRYNKYIAVTSQRSGQPGVNAQEYAEFEIEVSKKEEQTKIGTYFRNIDHLITLHQRKYDKLQNLKKAMLEKMFPKNGSNVPKIRFKGFTDAWEQRKLGDIASSFEYGLNAAAKEYDGENKYIRITDIDDNTHEFLTDNLTSPDIDLTGADNYKLTEGDILFARTGASVGKSYIYRNSDGLVYYAGFLIRARIKEEYDAEFVFQNTLTDRYNKYIAVTSQRSGQPGVNAQEYAEFEIEVSKKEEQTKIGTYFRNIDHLITLHQRKYDKLQNLKKAMLEKMFPKNGSNVPKIRFKGFTDAWEQRKFSDIALRESATQESSSDLPSVEYEDVISEAGQLNKNICEKETVKKGILFDGTQVLYGKLRPYLHNWLNLDFSGVAVGDWWVLKPVKADKTFLYRLIQTQQFDDIANQSAGSKMPRADWNLVSNTEFTVPVSLEEQAKIGEYFSSLDHLITLHQRELEKLKNIKKAMLEKMFV